MVLTINKKKILLVILVTVNVFIASNVCAVSVQGLIQYDETGDRDRLELLEDRQIMHIISDNVYSYQATSIYVIRNTGDEYKTTLGVLLFTGYSRDSNPRRIGMEFFVNNEKIAYNTITDLTSLTFGGETYDLHWDKASWALIDVSFPAESMTTIRVQYKNNFGPVEMHEGVYVSYNSHWLVSSMPQTSYWKGPTKFSLEVTNDYVEENNVEQYWVTDFRFDTLDRIYALTDKSSLHANEFLSKMKDMETNLMTIDRTTGNSFRIEFKEAFFEEYERDFVIYLKELNNDARFIHCNIDSRGISLEYQKDQYGNPRGHNNTNISERALGEYELIFFTNNQLRLMRNVFYAQYGYVFKSDDLRNIFANSPMMRYKPNPNFHEDMLTGIDKMNVETIKRLEAMAED